MNNIQNIDMSLQEIVKRIEKDTYLIPKFQRDFVWTAKDIVDLGDSLLRGYPISSILIMEANGTLNIGSHSLSKNEDSNNCSNDNDNDNDKEINHYILDGQQRLTSISKLFLTSDTKKEYYFDLLSILNEKFPDDKIKDDEKVKSTFTSDISDVFCRDFNISKSRDEKPTRQSNRFISGKSIINRKFGSVISKFLRHFSKDSDENIDKYTDHLNAVLGSLGGYSIPATVIASDSELGIVIRVFEKVNSTGKKLTLFDLINAKSFQIKDKKYKGGLTEYLTKKIKNEITENQKKEAGINKFFKFDHGNKKGFEKLGKIVRIFEITHLLDEGSTPGIFKAVMLKKDPEFWFDMWNKHGKNLLDTIYWMEQEGLIELGQLTFLEYVMAIFIANPKALSSKKFKEKVKKHTLSLALSGSAFNKSNLDDVESLYKTSKEMTDNHESTKYTNSSPVSNPNITADSILKTTSSSGAKFKAIMNIFYIEKVGGFFTVDITGGSIKNIYLSSMDNHHIYPKSRVENFTSDSEFNSIANIISIDKEMNRVSIKDKLPSFYFLEIKKLNKNYLFNCTQNLIDIEECIKVDNTDKALEMLKIRADEMAKKIDLYFSG